ncbi:MAG TPA: hypothetical protein ENK02_08255 [Planctomycetes bacterium]|nr:hypothetical protein [Planctomycetota bacterium]
MEAQGVPLSKDSAMGVWPWLSGSRNIDGFADEIISKTLKAGLDTIYISVWSTTGSKTGILRIYDEVGTWKTQNGKIDPRIHLRAFIQKAHKAHLQVIGVITVFNSKGPLPSDHGHQDFLANTVLRYLFNSYDNQGKPFYGLDGLALDYIRWFGGNHNPTEINRFLDLARKEIGPRQLHAYLFAGAYALDGGSYNNTFRTYAQTLSYLSTHFGQNWEDMARRLDCMLPMTYTANGHVYGTNLKYMEGYVEVAARYAVQAVNRVRSACRVMPAIRTWNSRGQTTTRATVEACARGAMKGGADGYMAFRYFTARSHADWFQGLARYANKGADLPIADLSGGSQGMVARVDSSGSGHASLPPSQLFARYDLDGDGRFETNFSSPGIKSWTLKSPKKRRVHLEIRDSAGHINVTALELGGAPTLTPTQASLSAARGGTVRMTYGPGSPFAGSFYLTFIGMSGTSPGTPLGNSVLLPLNLDLLSSQALGLVNQPPFLSFFHKVGFFGFAAPTLAIPAGILPKSFVGKDLSIAVLDLGGKNFGVRFASNPIQIRILP